jgi:hypothetical protein
MTNKDIAERLREIIAYQQDPHTRMEELADELDPPYSEPGTAVWYRRTDADPWILAIVEEGGEGIVFEDASYLPWFNVYEWKPAYVAPPGTDHGTEALIDELYNRIADLEERQLKPDEVAVKVPLVREWPEDAIEIYGEYDCAGGDRPVGLTIITRAEAEAREAGR